MQIKLKKDNSVILAPTGFSVSTFIFGFFVPLTRGDYKTFLLFFLIELVFIILTKGYGILFIQFIFALFYNKYFIKKHIDKGYEIVNLKID